MPRGNCEGPIYRDPLIVQAVRDTLRIAFPNSFCLHAALITSDSKLLRTRRSPKVEYHPNSWSVSVEEQLAPDDFRPNGKTSCLTWGKRLLREELGLERGSYQVDQFTGQSIFLEADVLNVSLCAVCRLAVSASELEVILRGKPRKDHEFTEWDFLDLSAAALLGELKSPTKQYHPSSGYRLLHVLLRQFGAPTDDMMAALGG